MRRIQVYRIFIYLFALFFCACIDEIETGVTDKTVMNLVEIKAVSMTFDPWNVTSKTGKNEDESKISSLQLFIFDKDGAYLESVAAGSDADNLYYQSYQRITTGNFTIDRTLFIDTQKAKEAQICILANAPELKSRIVNYNSLLEYTQQISDFKLTSDGLPMYGEMNADLSSGANGTPGTSFSVDLKCLMARIDMNINLSSIQSTPISPYFVLTGYDICNFPTGVKVRKTEGETLENSEIEYKSFTKLVPSGNTTITETQGLSFHFYMPEHKCDPNGPFNYPDKISENEKQRYKPVFAKDKATYIVLRGFYKSHQGVENTIEYKIYLGANHTNDYNIKRNCQYTNNISIKGITNHDNGTEGISIDHRVNVGYDNFLVSIERETLLDCHIEIRPMDIHLAREGTSVKVEILNPAQANWFRLEKKSKVSSGESNFCTIYPHTGKRKYFTTDLVTKTLANNTSATVTSNSDNRIWLYFDENLKASVDGMRDALLRMTYYDEKGAATEVIDYTFRQHDLFPVTYENRTYYIEYIEEYLYNFDPKDGYGITTDGMSWGLSGVQLSDTERAIYFDGGNGFLDKLGDWLANIFTQNLRCYYDYDNKKHAYNGLAYTKKLINKTGHKVLPLEELPKSAVEYCYNKNKRNVDGSIAEADVKWYMPGTDQIEDVVRGGYTTFRQFQNKYYWSSQPSYVNNKVIYDAWLFKKYGSFMQDQLYMARTAKVKSLGLDSYELITSESKGEPYSYTIYLTSEKLGDPISTGETLIMEEGNKNRNEIHRVRAIRADRN